MKICLVTAFPPSHERLNEYGYHLAQEMQRSPYLGVTVLADEMAGPVSELPGYDVVRCWRPNRLANPVRLLRTIRELKPDVVWYNLVFSSFGTNPAAAFLGLCAPAMTRSAGYFTHVTLHQLMETVNLQDAGVRFPAVYILFGRVATALLLQAHSVTVLLPAYGRTLQQRYRRGNVLVRAHGIFAAEPQYPDFSRRGNPPRILAFGKWGTYKKLELLLEAFPEVARAVPGCRLIIAGEDHPSTPGYLDALRRLYENCADIEFLGYIAENDLSALLSSACLMVMPYLSATGSSGVAHQACQFGLPIVCADIPDFREMAVEEGFAVAFYKVGDRSGLASAIAGVLNDPHRQRDMAEQNYSAAVRNTMPQILHQYLRFFAWQLRGRALARTRRVVPHRLPSFPWAVGSHAPFWNLLPPAASTLPGRLLGELTSQALHDPSQLEVVPQPPPAQSPRGRLRKPA
jgi:glycosyltransferase involved in cell wall biosynthesis